MSKKNNKKNSVIAADEVVAETVIATEMVENEVVETEPTVTEEVAEEETETEVHAADETAPEPKASAEMELTAQPEVEHKILVKSETGVTEVHVRAVTRQDAKYKVFLKLDQFGPNAKVPKFDVDKYLARQSKKKEDGGEGKKKGKAKAKVTMVVDLDDTERLSDLMDAVAEQGMTEE